jgi:cytochrome b6-f complex iron-sulfur subunit
LIIAIAIVVILLVAAVTVLLTTSRRRATTGTLSRETKQRDASAVNQATEPTSTSTELEATGRTRAEDTRAGMGGEVEPRAGSEVVQWEPVDEEEIGVSRRMFLNRAVLGVTGFSAGVLGIGVLGFLWPTGSTGFGGKVNAGSLDTIMTYIATNKKPFYVPLARTYVRPYPKSALPAAKKVPAYAQVISGMEEGVVALYQRCVHLGCRVPWCDTSQWFECPCHGSKYNEAGEYQLGPAPTGLNRFKIVIEGDKVLVDTSNIIPGPPRGTNTTHQSPEGPFCV